MKKVDFGMSRNDEFSVSPHVILIINDYRVRDLESMRDFSVKYNFKQRCWAEEI